MTAKEFKKQWLIDNEAYFVETKIKDVMVRFAEDYLKQKVSEAINELIESLGEPLGDNEYSLKPDKELTWWLEHKFVGSGEPLKQFLEEKLLNSK